MPGCRRSSCPEGGQVSAEDRALQVVGDQVEHRSRLIEIVDAGLRGSPDGLGLADHLAHHDEHETHDRDGHEHFDKGESGWLEEEGSWNGNLGCQFVAFAGISGRSRLLRRPPEHKIYLRRDLLRLPRWCRSDSREIILSRRGEWCHRLPLS